MIKKLRAIAGDLFPSDAGFRKTSQVVF